MDEDKRKEAAKIKELLDMGFITDEEYARRMGDLGLDPCAPISAPEPVVRPPSPAIPVIEPVVVNPPDITPVEPEPIITRVPSPPRPPPPPRPVSKPPPVMDDVDSLLDVPKSIPKPPPPRPTSKPPSVIDDLDSLLEPLKPKPVPPPPRPMTQPPKPAPVSVDDDLDSLLADIPKKPPTAAPGIDDIDDLLGSIPAGPVKPRTTHNPDEIDDLLNDLADDHSVVKDNFTHFESAELKKVKLQAAVPIVQNPNSPDGWFVDPAIPDHQKNREACAASTLAMVKAAASRPRWTPPAAPTEAKQFVLSAVPLTYGLEPNGVVVHCRQYVYYQTPLLPLPVKFENILTLFKWTDGELVQVSTQARTYDPNASIPAGYYELKPIKFRRHRMHWCDFSINRKSYDAHYHPVDGKPLTVHLPTPQRNQEEQSHELPKHKYTPPQFKVEPALQLVILLRFKQLKYGVRKDLFPDLKLGTPYPGSSIALHALLAKCIEARKCFICGEAASYNCQFACKTHTDAKLELLQSSVIHAGASLAQVLKTASTTDPHSQDREDDYRPLKAYPASCAKFYYIPPDVLKKRSEQFPPSE